jgi:hypothetical protein
VRENFIKSPHDFTLHVEQDFVEADDVEAVQPPPEVDPF